jgi:uncharacterized damage-inducible protein DinB
MTRLETFLNELQQETETTRKMLARVPNDKYDWKPHEKSMDIRSLSTHIAELPSWIPLALNTDELDFAAEPYSQTPIADTTALLEYAEKNFEQGKAALESGNDDVLDKTWILRDGANILATTTKAGMIRTSLSQIIHHRAQLGVYLRLLNIPIPGSYGPSADEMIF